MDRPCSRDSSRSIDVAASHQLSRRLPACCSGLYRHHSLQPFHVGNTFPSLKPGAVRNTPDFGVFTPLTSNRRNLGFRELREITAVTVGAPAPSSSGSAVRVDSAGLAPTSSPNNQVRLMFAEIASMGTLLTLNLLFAGVALVIGFALGAWLFGVGATAIRRRRRVEAAATTSCSVAAERAMMASQRIQDLAKNMVSDVDAHATKVDAINTELQAIADESTERRIGRRLRHDRPHDRRQQRAADAAGPGREANRRPGRRPAQLRNRSPHRFAHQPGQPPRVRRRDAAPLCRVATPPHAIHADDPRHRPLQAIQRFARPPGRRRSAPQRRARCW